MVMGSIVDVLEPLGVVSIPIRGRGGLGDKVGMCDQWLLLTWLLLTHLSVCSSLRAHWNFSSATRLACVARRSTWRASGRSSAEGRHWCENCGM